MRSMRKRSRQQWTRSAVADPTEDVVVAEGPSPPETLHKYPTLVAEPTNPTPVTLLMVCGLLVVDECAHGDKM
jgi:hypothetical protein